MCLILPVKKKKKMQFSGECKFGRVQIWKGASLEGCRFEGCKFGRVQDRGVRRRPWSILLAITEQRARQQGFWAGEVMQSRVPSFRCAGKRAHVTRTVRDLEITEHSRQDRRRFEVVVEGLAVFGGSLLAFDTTLVSVLQRDGSVRRKADQVDGVALQAVDVPRTPRQQRQNPTRRHCRGGGRSMVRRHKGVLVDFCVREFQRSVKDSARERPGCLAQEVERFLRVFSLVSIRPLFGEHTRVSRGWF